MIMHAYKCIYVCGVHRYNMLAMRVHVQICVLCTCMRELCMYTHMCFVCFKLCMSMSQYNFFIMCVCMCCVRVCVSCVCTHTCALYVLHCVYPCLSIIFVCMCCVCDA